MEKIFLDYSTYNMKESKTAWSKARLDCGIILEKYGYKKKILFISRNSLIKTLISVTKNLLKIKKHTNVIIQYPLGDNSSYITSLATKVCKIKQCNITLLIHDINSLRYTGKLSDEEIQIFKAANNIIVHNNSMLRIINSHITNVNLYILQAFDYFINNEAQQHVFDNTIVYAGNLQKSKFLINIKELGIKFNLYGSKINNIESLCNDNVQYKGAFQQEDLSILSGDWGLIWDGTSATTCDGCYGQYLKYNAPHKLSLYIIAKLPIIIWDQAAEAEFITNNKLGVTVKSLYDINNIISKISKEEYCNIKKNVEIYSEKLKNGLNLASILKKLNTK